MEVTKIENDFCTDEVPVRLEHGNELVLKFMNSITKVFYEHRTLTKCNSAFINLTRFPNGEWSTLGVKIEIARVGPVSIYNEAR